MGQELTIKKNKYSIGRILAIILSAIAGIVYALIFSMSLFIAGWPLGLSLILVSIFAASSIILELYFSVVTANECFLALQKWWLELREKKTDEADSSNNNKSKWRKWLIILFLPFIILNSLAILAFNLEAYYIFFSTTLGLSGAWVLVMCIAVGVIQFISSFAFDYYFFKQLFGATENSDNLDQKLIEYNKTLKKTKLNKKQQAKNHSINIATTKTSSTKKSSSKMKMLCLGLGVLTGIVFSLLLYLEAPQLPVKFGFIIIFSAISALPVLITQIFVAYSTFTGWWKQRNSELHLKKRFENKKRFPLYRVIFKALWDKRAVITNALVESLFAGITVFEFLLGILHMQIALVILISVLFAGSEFVYAFIQYDEMLIEDEINNPKSAKNIRWLMHFATMVLTSTLFAATLSLSIFGLNIPMLALAIISTIIISTGLQAIRKVLEHVKPTKLIEEFKIFLHKITPRKTRDQSVWIATTLVATTGLMLFNSLLASLTIHPQILGIALPLVAGALVYAIGKYIVSYVESVKVKNKDNLITNNNEVLPEFDASKIKTFATGLKNISENLQNKAATKKSKIKSDKYANIVTQIHQENIDNKLVNNDLYLLVYTIKLSKENVMGKTENIMNNSTSSNNTKVDKL